MRTSWQGGGYTGPCTARGTQFGPFYVRLRCYICCFSTRDPEQSPSKTMCLEPTVSSLGGTQTVARSGDGSALSLNPMSFSYELRNDKGKGWIPTRTLAVRRSRSRVSFVKFVAPAYVNALCSVIALRTFLRSKIHLIFDRSTTRNHIHHARAD